MTVFPANPVFIERVHQLLHAGYATLSDGERQKFNRLDEPDISGELAMRILQLLDSRALPGNWRAWHVGDNMPENEPQLPLEKRRLGKRRKLPDLTFRYAGLRETLYFRFEAKCLADTGAYEDLISENDGLGRFLRRVYGRGDAAGGLLAYVKIDSMKFHAGCVRDAFERQPKKYRIAKGGEWCAVQWKSGPICCFRTEHVRAQAGGRIAIYCTFLLFC